MAQEVFPWYFSMYMHTCVPLWMLGCIFIVTIIAIIIRWRFRYEILLGAYFLFILCLAVIFRDSSPEAHACLMPFWNYSEVFGKWNLEELGEIVMNIVLFIPVGIISGSCVMSHGSRKGNGSCVMSHDWIKVLLIGFGFSVFIELLQLLLHRGLCETDDVLHNTLGTLIGAGIVGFFSVLYKLCCKYARS